MFEIGKSYEFRTFEGGNETTWIGKVEKYEHPLLKTADIHYDENSRFFPGGVVRGQIVNVASPAFIGATLSRHQLDQAGAAGVPDLDPDDANL